MSSKEEVDNDIYCRIFQVQQKPRSCEKDSLSLNPDSMEIPKPAEGEQKANDGNKRDGIGGMRYHSLAMYMGAEAYASFPFFHTLAGI